MSRWTSCRDDGPNTELGSCLSGPFDVSFDSRGRRTLIDLLRKCCQAGEVCRSRSNHTCITFTWKLIVKTPQKIQLAVDVRCVLAFGSGGVLSTICARGSMVIYGSTPPF